MRRSISLLLLGSAIVFLCTSALPVKMNRTAGETGEVKYSIRNCVNEFNPAAVESTKAGYRYWFLDRKFAGGKTVKLSVVRANDATHPPHRHSEDEVFSSSLGKPNSISRENQSRRSLHKPLLPT